MTDDTTPELPKLLTSGGIAARHGVTRSSVESSPSLPPPDTIADTGGRKLRLWTVASADRWWRERRPKGYRSDLPGKYTGRVVRSLTPQAGLGEDLTVGAEGPDECR